MDMEYSAVHDAIEKYDEIVTNITDLQSEIISQERYKNRLTLELNEAETNVADIDEEKNKLKTLAKDVVDKLSLIHI